MEPNVAIVGPARSGKDSMASMLLEFFGYERASFADRLKEEVRRMLRREGIPADIEGRKELFRPLLQAYGMLRRNLDPEYWIRPVLESIRNFNRCGVPVVVTDARFANEIVWLEEMGFRFVELRMSDDHVREMLARYGGDPSILAHPSETEWKSVLEPDLVVQSIPGELVRMAEEIAEGLGLIAGFKEAERRVFHMDLRRFYAV